MTCSYSLNIDLVALNDGFCINFLQIEMETNDKQHKFIFIFIELTQSVDKKALKIEKQQLLLWVIGSYTTIQKILIFFFDFCWKAFDQCMKRKQIHSE